MTMSTYIQHVIGEEREMKTTSLKTTPARLQLRLALIDCDSGLKGDRIHLSHGVESRLSSVGFIEEEAVSHYVDFEIPDNSLSYICDSLSYEFEF